MRASRAVGAEAEGDLRWTVRHWAARIGVKVVQIHVRQMRTKWASISIAGRLTLNRDLLDLPPDLAEYVIVHELVHLLAPNHGRLFKTFLFAYLPDWNDRALRLAQHSATSTALPLAVDTTERLDRSDRMF